MIHADATQDTRDRTGVDMGLLCVEENGLIWALENSFGRLTNAKIRRKIQSHAIEQRISL